MSNLLSISVNLKHSKVNKHGLSPIYIRITLDGKRSEISTKTFIHKKDWNYEKGKISSRNKESIALNSRIDFMKAKIQETYIQLSYLDSNVTFESLLNHLKGKGSINRTLVKTIENHNEHMKNLIDLEYTPGTLKRYEITLNHIKAFLKHNYNITDIDINKIDLAFITDFDFYLRTVKNCANNTVVKYIKNFKKIIRQCLSKDWISKDPFLNYKSKYIEVHKTYLSQEELNIIINKKIEHQRLELVRDIFIFSCYTGLAYIDVKQLCQNHIIKGMDRKNWICIPRQKTDIISRIPLLQIPQQIIDKYSANPFCSTNDTLLPVITNQCMNSYLKEIAAICGINKTLTFHSARHTFATTVTLSNGVSIESVSKMLGHRSIRTTQHYAKITDKKISDDMKLVAQVLDKIPKKKHNKSNMNK